MNRLSCAPATLAAVLFAGVLAAGPTHAQDPIVLEEVASGLPRITDVAHAGDGSGRLFIARQSGEIMIFDGQDVLPTPFLDLSALVSCCGESEQGLFGIAFHPDYTSNGLFFVSYTDLGGDSRISRYGVSADPDLADAASAVPILSAAQPAPNHNGGQIRFGPDGMLYISLGDGGGGGDPDDNGQDIGTLLGSILRIDVDGGAPYAIPPDNPFVGVGGAREEIWAHGLRNPWRFSFDRLTGDLFIADVGQNRIEEINFQPAAGGGENYGWNVMEGGDCFSPPVGCDQTGLVLPILEYDHLGGDCSVTGGFRYRGAAYPQMAGMYFYADYCSGRIWGAVFDGGGWTATELLDTTDSYGTFGEDEAGELYIADYSAGSDGRLLRIKAAFPACDVEVGQDVYGEGEVISASVLELSNLGPATVRVEIKAWLGLGNGGQAGFLNFGATGGLALPPGFRTNLGPVPLLAVDAGTPKGASSLNCRFIDPVTGATLSLDQAPFEVQ